MTCDEQGGTLHPVTPKASISLFSISCTSRPRSSRFSSWVCWWHFWDNSVCTLCLFLRGFSFSPNSTPTIFSLLTSQCAHRTSALGLIPILLAGSLSFLSPPTPPLTVSSSLPHLLYFAQGPSRACEGCGLRAKSLSLVLNEFACVYACTGGHVSVRVCTSVK